MTLITTTNTIVEYNPKYTKITTIFQTPQLRNKINELSNIFTEIVNNRPINKFTMQTFDKFFKYLVIPHVTLYRGLDKISDEGLVIFRRNAPKEVFECIAENYIMKIVCKYKDYVERFVRPKLTIAVENFTARLEFNTPFVLTADIALTDNNMFELSIIISTELFEYLYSKYNKYFEKQLEHLKTYEKENEHIVWVNQNEYKAVTVTYSILSEILTNKKTTNTEKIDKMLSDFLDVFDLNQPVSEYYEICEQKIDEITARRAKKLMGDRHLRRHLIAVIKKILQL